MSDTFNPRDDQEAPPAGTRLREELGSAREMLHDATDAAKERATEFAGAAGATVRQQGDAVKGELSAALGTLAGAVRTAADDLAKSDQGMVAKFAQQAAGSLESISGALGRKTLDEMVSDVRGFGKANPALFMLGAVAAGVAIGRFVRTTGVNSGQTSGGHASARQEPSRSNPSSYASDTESTGGDSAETRPGSANPSYSPSFVNTEI